MTRGVDDLPDNLAATPVPLPEAKRRLSELARRVRQQHERIALTRNGKVEAVLLSVDDLDALEMTLEILGETDGAARIPRRVWQPWGALNPVLTWLLSGRNWLGERYADQRRGGARSVRAGTPEACLQGRQPGAEQGRRAARGATPATR